jgi:hypothetical protein
MRAINSILMRLAKRVEKLQPEYLVKSFVDVDPTYTLLSSTDNQIMFGRRGTGKTQFLIMKSLVEMLSASLLICG